MKKQGKSSIVKNHEITKKMRVFPYPVTNDV